jgi:hypothetical protein
MAWKRLEWTGMRIHHATRLNGFPQLQLLTNVAESSERERLISTACNKDSSANNWRQLESLRA